MVHVVCGCQVFVYMSAKIIQARCLDNFETLAILFRGSTHHGKPRKTSRTCVKCYPVALTNKRPGRPALLRFLPISSHTIPHSDPSIMLVRSNSPCQNCSTLYTLACTSRLASDKCCTGSISICGFDLRLIGLEDSAWGAEVSEWR